MTTTTFLFDEQSLMKRPITLNPQKNTGAKRADPNNPPWTEEMLGEPKIRRGRGPQKAPTKISTTIRLDKDVFEYFHAQGGGYQTQINTALRKVIEGNLTNRSARTRAKARAGQHDR